MSKKKRKTIGVFCLALLAVFLLTGPVVLADDDDDDGCGKNKKMKLLDRYVVEYAGGDEEVGLAHIKYWFLPAADPDFYDSLPPEEQDKVTKINANFIHAAAFQPTGPDYAGTEITGLLKKGRREQSISFRLPKIWNGMLAVLGTPGLRNQYANEAIFIPSLVADGFACISGDKGIPGGAGDMVSGKHPTQYWGDMMIDLAQLARHLLKEYAGAEPERTYVLGLSNGGYQVRRALEIDHQRVRKGKKRLFDGGVDWSGAYWPDKRVLDADGNGRVSLKEYAAADTLINSIDKGTLAMGWFHSPDTLVTKEEFDKNPRFPGAYLPMVNAGFSPESAIFWGYYNAIFDPFQFVPGFEAFRGVGYYNLVSYVYRADLRGDDAAASAAYYGYSDPANPDTEPPLYEWLRNAKNGGWNRESVRYALKNANTGEFSVPMLSLQGQADGLVALLAQGLDYKDAVERFGNPEQHRFYVIAHAPHVDKHVDGGWEYSPYPPDLSDPANVDVSELLTPMQAYVERAFQYLQAWVEDGDLPPDSKLVETDPANDITDPEDPDMKF